jgi:adenosine deaminase
VHLEGTVTPELARRIARRNGVDPPPDPYDYRDFAHFLELYDVVASRLRTADDYREVTREYLTGAGAVYVELTASAEQAEAVGVSDAEHVDAIARGIEESGVEAGLILACIRHEGPERAEELARRAVAVGHPVVVGFGMAGDETAYAAKDFARAFAIAHEGGLGCTAHAGEWAGPESVRDALGLPGVTRIAHGVRAIEDPALVEELAERGIVLEVCPTSNVALGVYPSYDEHPLRRLHDAGVRVTLGSDDPPFFGASIGGEYEIARTHFGFTEAELEGITATALSAAFRAP